MESPTQFELIEVVEAVRQVEARRRKPSQYKNITFFSAMDIWHYFGTMNVKGNQCETCQGYEGKDFLGSALRGTFPDLEILDENTIYPNVHMTLWGKDTCKCLLIRVEQPLNPFIAWGEEPE